MGQRGQSAPAASGARKGRGPGPREARGARPGLGILKTLVLVVVAAAVLMLVSADCALITRQSPAPHRRAAPQQKRSSPTEGLCPPGHHISEDSRDCISCKYGQDYSTHWNDFLFCLRCTKCDSGEVEVNSCTTTRNTVCQCKEGTFREEDSPEICRKCRTGCPRGMVKVKDCTPWSDIECVHNESGTKHTGEAPAVEKTVTTSPGTPASPCSLSGIIIGVTVAVVMVVAVIVWKTSLWKKVLPYLKGVCSGGGGDPGRMDSSSRSPQRPGAEDNALNENVSILQPTQVPEQEMEIQEPAEQTDVNTLSPGESERLLERAEAEGPQRRGLLVPVNENDPTETLRQCFDDFAVIVPFDSWEPLVRQLGLTDNEIKVAKAEAASSRDTLYAMLIKWVNKTGRSASVNTLLDALEMLGERLAKQKIQDRLLSSRKFMYLEDNADSAMS
ncbi:tumor necrosis factor receptor superfamily member 10B isoform X1 [Trachypithecus francoisi]|uniref:tumor necrosis factor receptor superfamily member 10B isoform X1 n=1 Tax=Trachypithecus francoisi TaxID=54180 RepID=UPI00141ADD1B|nr:tumor necrosis factor receptor superfamily member 10B isoform X1 [Trachypithecus francoisi]